jgi:hypothetical protein
MYDRKQSLHGLKDRRDLYQSLCPTYMEPYYHEGQTFS